MLARPDGLIALEKLDRHGDDRPPVVLIQTMFEGELQPLAQALVSLLEAADAIGRSTVDFWLSSRRVVKSPVDQHTDDRPERDRRDHGSREPDEIDALAARWFRQIQRNMRIVKYEREQ